MNKQFSACEIIEMGINIEKNGRDFYAGVAEKTEDPAIRRVFEDLSEAENEHIAVFQKMMEIVCDFEAGETYPEDYFSYIKALADEQVFTRKDKGKAMAEEVTSPVQGIDMAMKSEQESIIFYEEMRKFVPQKDRGLIDLVIQEEKKHMEDLNILKGSCDV